MHVGSLFSDIPGGFEYRDDFISPAEETELLEHIGKLTFENFQMRGAIARRRVAFFGFSYREGTAAAPGMPTFLFDLRQRLASWAGVQPERFAMALINEYNPGAPIGWHRDAPQYDIVAGVSLNSACRLKFRPYVSPTHLASTGSASPRRASHEFTLAPRSAYLLTGAARQAFEHSIPPVGLLRYSITFRTLRDSKD